MADLDQVLSSLLISLAKARQTADFQSAAIAEEYRRNPLLEGLAAPRIRVGEMELEFPMMIDAATTGAPNKFADSKTIATRLAPVIADTAEKAGLVIAPSLLERLQAQLEIDLAAVTNATGRIGDSVLPREAVSRRAQETVKDVLLTPSDSGIEPGPLRAVLAAVQACTLDIAEVDAGQLPVLEVNVLTSEVKEKALPSSVTRVRIVLKEEGLEWTSQRASDGGTRHSLTVE